MTIEAMKRLTAAIAKVTYQGVYVPQAKEVFVRKNDTGRWTTVVKFEDGVKAVVTQCENDEFDLEKAILWALVKRAYGRVVAKEKTPGKLTLELEGDGYATMVKGLTEKAVNQSASVEKAEKPADPPAASQTKVEKDSKPATATRRFRSKSHSKIRISRKGRNVLASSPVAKLRKSIKQMTLAEKREYWRWAERRRASRKAVEAKKRAAR